VIIDGSNSQLVGYTEGIPKRRFASAAVRTFLRFVARDATDIHGPTDSFQREGFQVVKEHVCGHGDVVRHGWDRSAVK